MHTMIGIMYALNVLSRYGNNPRPRHIEFLKHEPIHLAVLAILEQVDVSWSGIVTVP